MGCGFATKLEALMVGTEPLLFVLAVLVGVVMLLPDDSLDRCIIRLLSFDTVGFWKGQQHREV